MYKTTLLLTLQNLSTRERSRFQELVHADCWNKHLPLRQLCDEVLHYAPGFTHPNLAKERVHAKVYGPHEPFRVSRWNNLVSDLLQLLYDSLALEQWRANHHLQHDLLLMALQQREMSTQAERIAARWTKALAQTGQGSAEHFYYLYRCHDQLDQVSLKRPRRAYGDALQHKNDDLDRFYHLEKLRLACDMRSRSHVVKGGYQAHFLDDILQHYRQNLLGLAELPAAQVYVAIYHLLGEEAQPTQFQEALQLLEAQATVFPEPERQTLYSYLLNHCVKQINSGKTDYYRPTLTLYRSMLAQGLLLRNGQLSQWAYTNIVTTGMRLGEYGWVANFIETYRPYLDESAQLNVYNYNLAGLYFEQKKYAEALRQLQDVVFTDAFYHMAAKLIQLKIYYETGEIDALQALLEASRQFVLRNHQLSDYQQVSNLNFLRLLLGMQQLREQGPYWPPDKLQRKFAQLSAKLHETGQPVANKGWLTQQLALLSS